MNYTKEEEPFVKRMEGILKSQTSNVTITKFLNERYQGIIEELFQYQNQLHYKFYGGYENAEYKRCIISPYEIKEEDFKIELIEISYPYKFQSPTHRNVLGNLMHLGIKRETFGDILLNDHKIYIFITKEISSFFLNEFHEMDHYPIEVKEIQILPFEKKEEIQEKKIFLSSLRMDCAISGITNISRAESQELISQNLVQINHRIETNPIKPIKEGDLFSIRGYGRIRILSISGETKSGKRIVVIGYVK